ncbi:short-chain dehydrogenase/reductase SDR [Mycena rosella]|uniref:Short-chain dehydrogenase/reductase SDR n=1 Tax=Mycena rosella TaxID=1033263 RepID=A0AAD7CN16_MYCRO|nr:short-chain dehydrogenase/reductase SDR [Mycena rosella]
MVSQVVVIAGIGNGSGTGGAVARLFAKEGYTVALVSRGAESLDVLAKSIHASGGKAEAFPVPAYGPEELTAAFTAIHARYPAPEHAVTAAIFNAAHGVWKPFLEVTAEDVRESNKVNIEGSFAFARAAILAFQANELVPKTGKKGTLVFTGATASLRGNVITSAFASGRFAIRALSQSLAKEFGKDNIHVAHAIIDGVIATGNTRGDRNTPPSGPVENSTPDLKLSPESIAASYLYLVNQDRSAWTWELDLRPAHEKW